MLTGRTVRIFLPEGVPTGILVAEIMNWTGHVLVAPRSRLPEVLSRPEAMGTGVYILSGEDPAHPEKMRVYVGEADNIASRLRSHERSIAKDYWTHAYLVTSKDDNLTKAHARYIESRLVQMAIEAGRATVDNGTEPAAKKLPESDIADMEYFLQQLEILLPVVGVTAFRAVASSHRVDEPAATLTSVALRLQSQKSDADALGIDRDGELTVLAGSYASTQTHIANSYAALRKSLIDEGVILLQPDGRLRFSRDTVFASASAAAAVILNRNANGRVEWRLREGNMSLKEWQQSQVL